MGAQRLRDRLRLAARPLRSPVRALPARARVPARRRGLHGGVGGVRRRHQRADARGLPHRSSGRRGPAHPDVARARPRHRVARASAWRRARVDRDRRPGGRAGAGGRRAARRGELAVGVLRQRPHRPARARGRLAPAPSRRRSPRPLARTGSEPCWSPPASAALSLGLVKGEDWGWGSAATVGVLAFAALALALFVGALPARPQSARRPQAVPRPNLLRRLDRDAALLGRLRGDAAVHRALGPGRSGAGRHSRPGWPSLRAR